MAEVFRKTFRLHLAKFNGKKKAAAAAATNENGNDVQLQTVNSHVVKNDQTPVYKSTKQILLFTPCFGYGLNLKEVANADNAQRVKLESRSPSLKGAVQMIAIINAILSLVLVLDWVISTAFVAVNTGSLKDLYQEFTCVLGNGNKIYSVYTSNIKYFSGNSGLGETNCKETTKSYYEVTMYYRIYNLLYWIASGVLAKVLFQAASERNRPSIMVWATAEVILFAFWACFTIVKEAVMFPVMGVANLEYVLIAVVIPVFYKVYTFWVIFCFVREVRDCDQNSPWTDTTKVKPGEPNDAQLPVDVHFVEYTSKPWPENKEIHPSNLKVDHFIAKGIHGSVFRAIMENVDEQTGETMPSAYVAVKKIRLDMESENYDAILNELKIMSYIGTHPNIVNLIGACTTKIQERKLDIVLEYCPYPNLLDFIKANRGFFKNQLQRGGLYGSIDMDLEISGVYSTLAEIANSRGANLELVTTRDLVQWAIEIATGMQFLHSKKILHADLALRNVLLNNERVAKITDFGFSQSLYSAAKPYIPQKLSDLPWRWMAPEALAFDKKKILQLESDNWSYGVTLYELFTLGDPPHPTHRYNKAFVETIKVKPLEMPPFVPKEVYDNVMRRCWALYPAERISWPEIIEELAIALRNLTRPQHPPPQQHEQPPKPIVYVAPSEKIYYSSIEEESFQEKTYVAVPMKKWRPDGSFIMVEELRPLASLNNNNRSESMRKPPGSLSFNSSSTAISSRTSESFSHPPSRSFEATTPSGSLSRQSGRNMQLGVHGGSFSHYPGRSSEASSSARSSFSHYPGRSSPIGPGGGGSFSQQPSRGARNVFRTPTMPSPATSPSSPRPYMHLEIENNRFSSA